MFDRKHGVHYIVILFENSYVDTIELLFVFNFTVSSIEYIQGRSKKNSGPRVKRIVYDIIKKNFITLQLFIAPKRIKMFFSLVNVVLWGPSKKVGLGQNTV